MYSGTVLVAFINMFIFHIIYSMDLEDLPTKTSAERKGANMAYGWAFFISLVIADVFVGFFDEAVIATFHCMAMDT